MIKTMRSLLAVALLPILVCPALGVSVSDDELAELRWWVTAQFVGSTPTPNPSPEDGGGGLEVSPQDGGGGLEVSPQDGGGGLEVSPQEGGGGSGVFAPDWAPFSFIYGGKPSAELLETWTRAHGAQRLDDQRTEHTLTFTDPQTGLVVRCVVIERPYFNLQWDGCEGSRHRRITC